MQTKELIGAVVLGISALGGGIATGGCSKAEPAANTAAAQTVNAKTPTVEEILAAKKRDREEAANKAAAANPMVQLQQQMPKTTPPAMPKLDSMDWKKIADNQARQTIKNLQQR